MSDRVKLARGIAARTQPRFIEIKPEPRPKARLNATFIEIQRERGGGRVPFTEAELAAMRGGLTAKEYRWKTIRKWSKR
jgi:hypothetical protein